MSQDHHHWDAQVIHVLHGADLIGGGHVPGHPDDEEIADPLIEDQFHRRPGIGAGEHRGKGVLPLAGGQGPARRVLAGMRGLTLQVAGVAVFEHLQGLIGREPGIDPRGQGRRR